MEEAWLAATIFTHDMTTRCAFELKELQTLYGLRRTPQPEPACISFNLLKPTGYVMHQQFNIQ